ncbi:MAG TPA: Fe-S cluster assembly protein SufD [Candidatus Deferrimicrobium sp.]|nr:Fe-S cluster assembly protein SufD [Candidatus Deferrimicrobium sp.]
MSNAPVVETDQAGYMIDSLTPALERGPQWLREKRHQSREAFNSTPLPRRGLHLWRYTDPSKFLVDLSALADTPYSQYEDAVESVELKHLTNGHLSGLATDYGGRDIRFHPTSDLLEKGILFSNLSGAVTSDANLVQSHLYELVNGGTGKFEALNGALFNDGILIRVPDGCSPAQPLHLLREAGGACSGYFPRLLIVVGKNAELTVVDEYAGGSSNVLSGPCHTNSVVEIFGHQDSRIRYVSLQRQEAGAHLYLTHRARIERGASMLTVALAFGGAVSKQNFGVILNGDGAESAMYGLLFGMEHQHFDNHTLHHHTANRTTSNIDFKVVLRDRAQSAYTGLIRIDKTAKGCEAYQVNRNLLLNKGTRAETIPELEILNEDVKCTHGATLGPIDPLSVFYLTSRGIPRHEATQMIVSGFVEPTLKQIPDDLRERITGFVTQRLERG